MDQALIEQEITRRQGICIALDVTIICLTLGDPPVLRRGATQDALLESLGLPKNKENRRLVNERMLAAGYRPVHLDGYGCYKAISNVAAKS